jgi:spore coat polysaccharide biosynthesis predicted glycosyltransferase SpsG
MLPKRVIFAANASNTSGAGHLRRLIEIAKALPKSIEKHLIGSIDIPWLKTSTENVFLMNLPIKEYGVDDLVVLDSYEKEFCLQIESGLTKSQIIQIADRYTFLLPRVKIVFLDLPFVYGSEDVASRVISHGIEYLPIRAFKSVSSNFKPVASRVLITTGGVVNERIYEQLIQEFSKDVYSAIDFEFIGFSNTDLSVTNNLRFHPLGESFDTVAARCDTSISAAGTTMWDLLANQMMLGIAATVKNQRANFDYAVSSNQALPVFDPETQALNLDNLKALLFDQHIRQKLYKGILGKYNFFGATRTSEAILNSFIESYASK